ncbi:hypothetical protein ACFYO1_06255 [Nocardia sp. NPDC006044]|uniref:hypothetical protein n=1 Tax=Nocardia sp. NPDC006044 TaxID=3364306 RepID=UPI0036BA9875
MNRSPPRMKSASVREMCSGARVAVPRQPIVHRDPGEDAASVRRIPLGELSLAEWDVAEGVLALLRGDVPLGEGEVVEWDVAEGGLAFLRGDVPLGEGEVVEWDVAEGVLALLRSDVPLGERGDRRGGHWRGVACGSGRR